MSEKCWEGDAGACDMCEHPFVEVFYDAKTTGGPWAVMCDCCFTSYGVGLGTGKGQRYELNPTNNKWIKTAG